MSEYCQGVEDALDLVDNRMQRCKDKIPNSFKKTITDIINRVKESKVVKLERELDLND